MLVELWRDPYKRRWIGWGVLAAAYVLTGFHRASTAVIANDLMGAFDTTGAGLGFLHSSYFYLYAALQLPAGIITDRFGSRTTATMGTMVMSLGAVVFGVATFYWVAFLGRLLMGLGASVLLLTILRYCANWFRPDEFATLTGITLGVSILGGAFATTPLALAVSAIGWRATLVGLGAYGFVSAAVVYLVAHNTPEAAGFDPIENVPSTPTASWSDLKRHAGVALREAETWAMGLLMFLSLGVGFTIFGLWGIPYLTQLYGISVTEASFYLLVGTFGSLIGSPTVGWLSDRVGRRTEFIVVAAVAFALSWTIIAAWGTPPLLIIAAIFFLMRLVRSGMPLVLTVMKEAHSQEVSATATSIVNSLGWFGAALFPPIVGALLDAYWTGRTVQGARAYTEFGYRVGFAIAALAGVVTVVCALWLHARIERPEGIEEPAPEASPGGSN